MSHAGLRTVWVYGRGWDSVLAWCFLPVFLVGHALSGRATVEDIGPVGQLFAAVLLASLVHQPLTLVLVYGDRRQLAARRRFFVVAPLVALLAVAAAVVLDLWLIVPVAAVWNAVHTLQQRYGLLRIYARKSGYGAARLDRAVVYLPFLAVLIGVALTDTASRQLSAAAGTFGQNNSEGVRLLLDNRPVLLALLGPAVLATLVLAVRYLAQERRAVVTGVANPAKWNYLAGSLMLLLALLVDPLAGLTAYVAAHAVEYVVVVARTLSSRYDGGAPGAGPLSVLAASAPRRVALLVGTVTLLVVGVTVASEELSPHVYLVIIYTVGVLHFTYDAVIWKVRRPAVAASFGIPAQTVGPVGSGAPAVPGRGSSRDSDRQPSRT